MNAKTKAKTKKTTPLTSHELVERLRLRYPAPEWVTLEEIQPTVGWMTKPRRADFVALSTWESRGLRLFGFEIKSSRADVLKELAEPEKSQAWQRYCDRWYLVVGRGDLIGEDELPPQWGLIAPHGTGLRVKVHAPELTPEAWPRGLTCMLARRAFGNTLARHEKEAIRREAHENAKQSASWYVQRAEELEAKCKLFHKHSGISIAQYSSDDRIVEQGKLLREITTRGLDRYELRARSLAEQLETVGKQLREALGEEKE